MSNENTLSSRELLIVDALLPDIDALLPQLACDTDTCLVSPGTDPADVLDAALRGGYSSIHLLGHGCPGSIRLGEKSLVLDDFKALAGAGRTIAPSWHFWSCMTGAGEVGRRFVDGVSRLFDSAVSAFSGLVGDAEQGGSWTPDVLSGCNAVVAPFTGTPVYAHTLVVSDAEAPELQGSFNAGNTLTLTFSESITGALAGDFTVSIAGEAVSVTSVSVSTNQLILRLDSQAAAGELVRFSYDGDSLQDASGNRTAPFSAASFVYSTQYWGTLFDRGRDDAFDFMKLVEYDIDDSEQESNIYRIVAGRNTDASADYTAQKVMEFGLGDVDTSGRPTTFIVDGDEYDIVWLAAPGDKGEVARASMIFYKYSEGEEDIEQEGTLYFFRSDDDPAKIGSLELWYTPEGALEIQKYAALDVLGYETDESGNPESMITAATFIEESSSDWFDFSMDGDAIVLPYNEFGEPSGFFPVELFQDTIPGDDIIARFTDEHSSGFLSDLDDDGQIDFLRVIEDGDDDPDDYCITWDDELHWTAHRIEHLTFADHDAGHRPHTLIVDGGEVTIAWAGSVVDHVVATATFDGGEAVLSFLDTTGDGVPDQIRYDGADGSELFDIPASSWVYESGNPVSAWAVVTTSDGDNDDRVFSGMMEFDGDGNPVTLLVPESGEGEYDSSVYIADSRLVFDTGVDGVTFPGTGNVTITHITSSGVHQRLAIPVSSLDAEGSTLFLPLSGNDSGGSAYTIDLARGSMIRLELPDGMLADGDMKAWELWSESGSDEIRFSAYQVSCCTGAGDRDWLFGTSGNDTIAAGRDSDFIEWSGGNDTVDGGDGHDTLFLPWNAADSHVAGRLDGTGVYHLYSQTDGLDRYAVTKLAGDNTILVRQLDGSGATVSSVRFSNGEALRAGFNWEISVCVQDMNNDGYINASPWNDQIAISVNDGDFADLLYVQGYTGDDTLAIDFGAGYSGFSVQDSDSRHTLFGTAAGGGSSQIATFAVTPYNGITVTADGHAFTVRDVEHFRFVSGTASTDVSVDSWSGSTDTTPPVLGSAVINGSSLTLTYNENLGPAPSGSAFTVMANGSRINVSSVSVYNGTMTLNLSIPVQAGHSVTVSYTDPSGSNDVDAIQDAAGNDAASFTNYAVTNNTSGGNTYNYYEFHEGSGSVVAWAGSEWFRLDLSEDGDGDDNTWNAALTFIDQEDGHTRPETGTFTFIDTDGDNIVDRWRAALDYSDTIPMMGDSDMDGKPDGFYADDEFGVDLAWQSRDAHGVVATFAFADDDGSVSGSLLDLDGDGELDYARITENGLTTMQKIALIDTDGNAMPDELEITDICRYEGDLQVDGSGDPQGIWFSGHDEEITNDAAPALSLDNSTVAVYRYKAAGVIDGADADATDADGNMLVFTLDAAPEDDAGRPLFSIDAETGQISLTEAGATCIQSAELSATFDLTVRVTDGEADHDRTTTLTIALTDKAASYECAVNVRYWQFDWGIEDATVMMTDDSSNETPGQPLDWGEYDFGTLEEGEYTLTATRTANTFENDLLITVDDAEAALDLALGHGDSSPYRYLAADIDRNGTVGFRDALGILKMALHREDAPEPEWAFVPESIGSEPMDRDNVIWPDAEMPLTLNEDTEVDLVGILLGDVELAGLW